MARGSPAFLDVKGRRTLNAGDQSSAMGRIRTVVTLGDFCLSSLCYAESNGRLRLGAVFGALRFLIDSVENSKEK